MRIFLKIWGYLLTYIRNYGTIYKIDLRILEGKMELPIQADISEIDNIMSFLSSKIKEIPLDEAQKVNKKWFTDNNISAFEFLGLIERNSMGIKLTEEGRKYTNAQDEKNKNEIIILSLKKIKLYDTTLEYIHHNKKSTPTKAEVGSYWNDSFKDIVGEFTEEQISASVLFFFRLLDKVELGKFVSAGRGRESHIALDNVKLAEYVTKKLDKIDFSMQVKHEIPSLEEEKKGSELSDTSLLDDNNDYSPSSLRALSKLQIGLSWKDLDSDGAKKLIIEKLDDLQQENTVLKAKVEKNNSVDRENAVLLEKNKNLSNFNIVRTSINSIGGILLGANFGISDIPIKVTSIILGALLIFISIFFQEKAKGRKYDENI